MMLRYAKVTNKKTKDCDVGLGTNYTFYRSLGMVQMNVEKSDLDGIWYVAGHAPIKSEDLKRKEKAEIRIVELQTYLASTDWYAIRYADTAEPIPVAVKDARASARAEIDNCVKSWQLLEYDCSKTIKVPALIL